jgi:hypothetical protein
VAVTVGVAVKVGVLVPVAVGVKVIRGGSVFVGVIVGVTVLVAVEVGGADVFVGSSVGGVSVGGAGVFVGSSVGSVSVGDTGDFEGSSVGGVSVGGAGVFVGSSVGGVSVGDTGVFVGSSVGGVSVGGAGVFVGSSRANAWDATYRAILSTTTTVLNLRANIGAALSRVPGEWDKQLTPKQETGDNVRRGSSTKVARPSHDQRVSVVEPRTARSRVRNRRVAHSYLHPPIHKHSFPSLLLNTVM